MTTPDAALLATAVVGAGALTLAEAASVGTRLPGGGACWLWVRRTPLRTVALSLLLIGLRRWCEDHAGLIWHDLQGFLLQQPPVALVPLQRWLLDGALVLSGLMLLQWTYPPVVSGAVGGLLGFGAPLAWAVVVWLYPLAGGHAGQLLGGALLLACPGWWMSRWNARRLRRSGLSPVQAIGLDRLRTCFRRLAVGWLAISPLVVSDRWSSAAIPALVASLAALASVAVLWRVAQLNLREELPDPARRFRTSLSVVAEAWALRQPVAWALACALACTGHWLVVVTAVPAAARTGRAALEQVTQWPQLLTGQPDPAEADWAPVVQRAQAVLNEYAGHRWCGRWLLVLAWIESSRRHHFHTAAMLLRQAKRTYPRALATAPPGWPRGRTVGRIAERTLAEWGRLIEPGAEPG